MMIIILVYLLYDLGKLQRTHSDRIPGTMVNKGNHPYIALIQVSEMLQFTKYDDNHN